MIRFSYIPIQKSPLVTNGKIVIPTSDKGFTSLTKVLTNSHKIFTNLILGWPFAIVTNIDYIPTFSKGFRSLYRVLINSDKFSTNSNWWWWRWEKMMVVDDIPFLLLYSRFGLQDIGLLPPDIAFLNLPQANARFDDGDWVLSNKYIISL